MPAEQRAADEKSKAQSAPEEERFEFFGWVKGFCFQRFTDEDHRAWLESAPAWMEALPFRWVFVLVWNILAVRPQWGLYLTFTIAAGSMVAMLLQIIAMSIIQADAYSQPGYWLFYVGSFGSPNFEIAWLLTQFLLGLAAEHAANKAKADALQRQADEAARQRKAAAPSASSRQNVHNPLDSKAVPPPFPGVNMKLNRSSSSITSSSSRASTTASMRQSSTPNQSVVAAARGASEVQLSEKQSSVFLGLLENKKTITRVFSVMLWFAWAVHIAGLYVYSHACASFRSQNDESVVQSVTAFNCLNTDDGQSLLNNPTQRFAMVGQLLHAIAACVMLVVLWAMPPSAPFQPHAILKWGVLGFAVTTFTQLAFAVTGSNESTSDKTWGQTLALFTIRVMSSVFAVLAVTPIPPLSYLIGDDDDDEENDTDDGRKESTVQLSAGATPQDTYRRRLSSQAIKNLQEKQLNSFMQCSRWSMVVGLSTYIASFVAFALLPLTGGTFALSWGRNGFFDGTGLSVYEVLLPLAIVSPLLLSLMRTVFLAMLSIHELCHRVYGSRALYGWLTKYCLGCCCEVTCFVACCCYCCCKEEQERVYRGKFGCPNAKEALRHCPLRQCFVTPAKGERQPILGEAPSERNTASASGQAAATTMRRRESKRLSFSSNASGGADHTPPTVHTASPGSSSSMFATHDEPSHVLKLLREGLSESDVLAGVTEKPSKGQLVRGSLQGLAQRAQGKHRNGTASAQFQREQDMQDAANGLSNLSIVDLLNDDQYHNLLAALLPQGAIVYKGAPSTEEQAPQRALPTRQRKKKKSADSEELSTSIVAADRSQISWMPYSVWGVAFGCMLVAPLLRAMEGDKFFYYGKAHPSEDERTFAQTRFTLMLLLLVAYCATGAFYLRRTLRLLHRIRKVVEAAVSLDIHAMQWKFPYDVHGAAEWSARLLFASRFVGAQFTGPAAGFVSAWLLGTSLSAATLAFLVILGADWPHALQAPEFYAFCTVVCTLVSTGLFMLWQLLQTDDIIFGSIRDVSVLSARGGVVNTYRTLMADYANTAQSPASTAGSASPQHSLGADGSQSPRGSFVSRDPAAAEKLQAASFAQLLAISWQQRYPGVQIMLIQGLELSRVTISKASFRALLAGTAVSGISAVGRLVYAQLMKKEG